MNQGTAIFRAVLVVVLGAAASLAQAQATRTWVSGVGDDANPCSRTAPCKTFAGAISKTAAGGVINALDPAGYGGVTITKSITLEADGVVASALVAGTNAIIVNAGANDQVTLRGLKLTGIGQGLNGVRFLNGSRLTIERCEIYDFTGSGVSFEPSAASTLAIRDTVIRHTGISNGGAVTIAPNAPGSATATLDNVSLLSSGYGMSVLGPAFATVRNSTASLNTGDGFLVGGNGEMAQLFLDEAVSSGNLESGVFAQGAASLVRLSGTTLTGNTQGIQATTGGQVVSFGNNRNAGNVTNGTPTSSVDLQ